MKDEHVIKQITPEVEAASNIALVLEMIFGWFGLLGVGHAYTGRIGLAIGALIGWWLFIIFASVISSITLGIALCLFVPVYIAVPVISGIQARSFVRQMGETGNWGAVAGVAGGGCLLLIIAMAGLFLLGVFASFAGTLAG